MSGINMTISEQILLEKCREIELLCKQLYDYFAELYAGDEDAVRLWCKTAMEEQNHADQFTLALKLRKGMSCMVVADSTRVDSIIKQLGAVISKVRAEPPKLVDALNSSIRLEKYLVDFHLSCVVMFEEDSFKKMFNAMMASDQEHIASLQDTYDLLTCAQAWTFTG